MTRGMNDAMNTLERAAADLNRRPTPRLYDTYLACRRDANVLMQADRITSKLNEEDRRIIREAMRTVSRLGGNLSLEDATRLSMLAAVACVQAAGMSPAA